MSGPLVVPGFHFKVSKNLLKQIVEIDSYFQYVIPKPAPKDWLKSPAYYDTAVEMHYLDDHGLVAMTFQWLETLYKSVGDWFTVLCNDIEKQYKERYKNKPDYVQERIMQEVRSWLSTGFKEFMDHNFHPIAYSTTKPTLEQYIQDYVVKEISDKYFHSSLVSSYMAQQVGAQLQNLSRQLPGVTEYVKPICCCPNVAMQTTSEGKVQLWRYIQHLNDYEDHAYYINPDAPHMQREIAVRGAYTREEIADWLETLDIDIRFKTPERIRNEQD